MFEDYEINIRTSQADATDFVSIEPVEIRGRQFPWDKQEILEHLKDPNMNAIRTTLNFACQAWCLFNVVDGNVVIHRLTVKDNLFLHDIMDSLFTTLTTSPQGEPCLVSMTWPEHATDDHLFLYLLAHGWSTCGLVKDQYDAYGSTWDGIKIERQF